MGSSKDAGVGAVEIVNEVGGEEDIQSATMVGAGDGTTKIDVVQPEGTTVIASGTDSVVVDAAGVQLGGADFDALVGLPVGSHKPVLDLTLAGVEEVVHEGAVNRRADAAFVALQERIDALGSYAQHFLAESVEELRKFM